MYRRDDRHDVQDQIHLLVNNISGVNFVRHGESQAYAILCLQGFHGVHQLWPVRTTVLLGLCDHDLCPFGLKMLLKSDDKLDNLTRNYGTKQNYV